MAIIGNSLETKAAKPATSAPNASGTNDASESQKKWTDVYIFKGNGMKKSPSFMLTGNEARLKYRYKSEAAGIGAFSAYVVPDGEDIMKTGGFPEVMTQAEREESETSLHKDAGRYYLNVSASGNWEVTVQELR
jgi:hypothetical protein